MTEELETREENLNEVEAKESKLVNWANAPKLTDLKQDFEDAKSSHDSIVSTIDEWLDNLHIRGGAKPKQVNGRSSVAPKLIRKQAEWRYSSLSEPFLSTEDVFNVEPVTYEDRSSAHQNGLILNNQFNTVINKTAFIDEYVRTAVDEGTVIVRVGWDYQEDTVKELVPTYSYVPDNSQDTINTLQNVGNLMQTDMERYEAEVPDHVKEAFRLSQEQGIPVRSIQDGEKEITTTKVVKNAPTVEVCNYKNVIIDPSCEGVMDRAKFVIYSFNTSKSELEKDGRYVNIDKVNLEAGSILSAPDHAVKDDSNFNFNDDARKQIVAYEYWGFWDIEGDGVLKAIVVTWIGNTIIRMEENPFPDGKLPFVFVPYMPLRKSVYGEPDGELLKDNQKIIGAVTRGMIDILGRSANGQTGIRKDALDITNRRKFDKGLDYEINPGVDPRQAFHMHTFPEIPQSAQVMLEMQNQDAESLTGVKAFASGISGQALGNTATGIRSALDATSKRELGILRRLADGIKQIGRKIIAMNAEFLNEEEVVRVTNEEFIKIRRDDLAGNFDLKLSISTPEADEQKAQELSFMLQTLGNNVDFALVQIVLSEISRLRKMPELAKRIEEYKPQPDPLVEQEKQLRIQLLQAQIANENAKARENNANGMLDEAKTQETLAKTRVLGSQADLNDLNFIEQESGVHQERKLEAIDRQTQGNVLLKNIEAAHKQREKANEKESQQGGTL